MKFLKHFILAFPFVGVTTADHRAQDVYLAVFLNEIRGGKHTQKNRCPFSHMHSLPGAVFVELRVLPREHFDCDKTWDQSGDHSFSHRATDASHY